MAAAFDITRAGLLFVDLQNDFIHPDGAYGRAGQGAAEIAALPVGWRHWPRPSGQRRAGSGDAVHAGARAGWRTHHLPPSQAASPVP